MLKTTKNPKEVKFKCESCKKKKPEGEMHFRCVSCGQGLCESCYQKIPKRS